MENNTVKKVLTSKEAVAYLGCSEYSFEQEVKRGNISFKTVGRIRLFPVWALDKWLNDTQIHIDCSNVAKSTTHTYRSQQKQENGISLESLLMLHQKSKPSNIVSRGLQSYKRKPSNKPQMSFHA